ncbi:uncharacterized protein TRIADDRAFT_56154 [Trichoplax adhaerens]|uniref:Hyaluronan-mediated motility receptor C-terminal domain-containing protein n=1 Tax=Trichoplax adhaerens TaxID=10228 RepID=B3RXB9_TRIAD|nr:hypothetical protein TRIADDRAFT_56154 [Trichoplax adhaerens]EDV24842.1 hypothetical protein TRIADDRAFT_56154 [Trichoplax adhaerens]|eukprot:XP_002112732.1 hypothetical protein TRIADDRAFT_56154 [Trichoplax adhaerens]
MAYRGREAQLEEYEEEKKLLLYQNKEATKEVNQLSKNYAKLLGHQNNKQKIQHIKRIKEENLRLKQEVVKLQDQLDKEKRSTRKLENQILHETTNTFDRLATPLKPCINSGNIMKTTSVKKSR